MDSDSDLDKTALAVDFYLKYKVDRVHDMLEYYSKNNNTDVVCMIKEKLKMIK